tara:strand:+ start:131 stop:1432 length:1302 start_codon:yes stop_codon:yes gene_type:complete
MVAESKNRGIKFVRPERSDWYSVIEVNIPESLKDYLEFTVDSNQSGYEGNYNITIGNDAERFQVEGFKNSDETRFPARLKALATVLRLKNITGRFSVEHSKGVFKIKRLSTTSSYWFRVDNPNTNFFIFDTGRIEYRDIDFEVYSWNRHKFNLVKLGDLFIYRKPTKASENGKFYFFGAGKIESISEISSKAPNFRKAGDLQGTISEPVKFENFIFQDQIHPSDLNDTRKKKDDSWTHFFNNYGMNQIRREEFSFLLDRGLNNKSELDIEQNELRVNVHKKILQQNYEVSDSIATVKTRAGYQKIFRNHILPNYDFRCAITGIKTPSLLKAAHIVRWSDNEKTRLDPKNGICLSSLVDECFEKGYLYIDSNYRVRILEFNFDDPVLGKEIGKYEGKKINLPKNKDDRPRKEFLMEHKKRIEELNRKNDQVNVD